ncbi:MAG: AI-2E family transporter [Selenomonadaceae bacterium]|nr:AI-2E family transporter [Selenomonadaceae bacterium]
MWLQHKASFIIAITFILLFSAFWFLPAFAFIFFISLLLELLLCKPVDILSKRLPRSLAAGIVLLSFLCLVAGIFIFASSSFVPTLTSFATELPELAEKVQNLSFLQESDMAQKAVDEAWSEFTNIGTTAVKSSLVMILSLFNKLIDFVIILFVTFYLLMDGAKIKSFLVKLFPADDYKRIISLMDAILASLQAYIRSQLFMCCLTGVIVYIYFTIMDLPYASVFAVVSGVSEFIPVLGPTVASCFGILLTATTTPWMAVQTAIFYLLLTQINHNLVYPAIVGKSLSLHPIAIILGIILGGELLDAAGMFLAVPCIVVFKHVIEDIHRSSVKILSSQQQKHHN